MSINRVVSRFSKCGGDLRKYSRKLHNLTTDQQRIAAELIATGTDAEKAIKTARAGK